ncbi:MAG: cyclic nucleotide-binding domain-containing protein [Smithella sp.]|nr:cyclic nucleotide-binding domain-containing protein [Syntrophaceae bacterium]NTW77983.1 cyclic nucleotide-binding domain-containing protein [Syntrophaceae bacterium]
MVPVSALKECIFFKGFDDGELNKLSVLASEEKFLAGTHMYQNGDLAKSLYLIKEGKIVLYIDNYMGPKKPPMQVTVDMIIGGEATGWSAVVEPYLYTLSALCIDDTQAIVIDAVGLRRLMNEDYAIGFKIMQAVSKTIASNLTHTRIILVGERSGSVTTE